jgi:glutaredoxin
MLLQRVTDKVRIFLGDALASHTGNQYKPVRILREALGTANDLVGRPLCSADELRRRRGEPTDTAAGAAREAAPVMVYFDGKDHRTKKKIEELLKAKNVPYSVLDVTDDEATRSWAVTQAKLDEFPLVFIAGESVGGLHELTQLDVNGGLTRRVFGS